jgi:fructose-1,6-bisphosphatase/inositol monophosphatase family enzyme
MSATVPSLDALVDAVREVARTELLPRFRGATHARYAKADGSFSTEADHAAQAALSTRLAALADVPIVGEEMKHAHQLAAWAGGGQGVWVIDPVDGTTNFASGIPYFAVSVAYMVNGRSRLGVIHNPVSGETFRAEQGRGAWLGEDRLPLRTADLDLSDAVAAIEEKRLPRQLALRAVEAPPFHSMRNFGAGVLHWCELAAGRMDLFLNGGQELWDYAAGYLMLQEAGGSMCMIGDDDFFAGEGLRRSVIAARTPRLFEQWKAWVRAHAGVLVPPPG